MISEIQGKKYYKCNKCHSIPCLLLEKEKEDYYVFVDCHCGNAVKVLLHKFVDNSDKNEHNKEKKENNKFCVECQQYITNKNNHSTHTLLNDELILNKNNCSLHSYKKAKYFCRDCKEYICTFCCDCLIDHQNHTKLSKPQINASFELINEIITNKKDYLEEYSKKEPITNNSTITIHNQSDLNNLFIKFCSILFNTYIFTRKNNDFVAAENINANSCFNDKWFCKKLGQNMFDDGLFRRLNCSPILEPKCKNKSLSIKPPTPPAHKEWYDASLIPNIKNRTNEINNSVVKTIKFKLVKNNKLFPFFGISNLTSVLVSPTPKPVNCIEILSDGRIVAGLDNGFLAIFDPKLTKLEITIKTTKFSGISCLLEYNNNLIFGTKSGKIKMCDINTVSVPVIIFEELAAHEGEITSMVFLSNKKEIASSSLDGTIKMWSFQVNTLVLSIALTTSSVRSMCALRNGTILVSSQCKNTLIFWGITSKSNIKEIQDISTYSHKCMIEIGGNRLLVGGEFRIYVIETIHMAIIRIIEHNLFTFTSFVEIDKGILLVAYKYAKAFDSLHGIIGLYCETFEAFYQEKIDHKDLITDIILLKEGVILTSSDDGNIKMWNYKYTSEEMTMFIN